MKLESFNPSARIFGLFKGDPGAGKSVGVASFAATGKQYWFDFDGKIGAVYNFYKNIVPRPDILANIEYDTFESYNDAADKLADIGTSSIYKGGIVWDTLTTSVDKLITQVQRFKGADSKKTGKLKMVGGIQVSDIEDYNAETAALTRLVQFAKFECPVHFFMLAHVITTETTALDGTTTQSRQLVTAGKKVAAKLPAYFNEIWHFQASGGGSFGQAKYEVITSNSGVDFARTSMMLPKTIDFTGNKLLEEQIKKELTTTKLGQ